MDCDEARRKRALEVSRAEFIAQESAEGMNAEDAIGMADAAFGEQESSPGKHPVDGGAPHLRQLLLSSTRSQMHRPRRCPASS